MVSVAACPHLGQVIVDCRIGTVSDIEITSDQQHNADDEANERQKTHCGWRAYPIGTAIRSVPLLPPQEDSSPGEGQRSDHQKQSPVRRGDGRYPSQPSGAEAQTDQK